MFYGNKLVHFVLVIWSLWQAKRIHWKDVVLLNEAHILEVWAWWQLQKQSIYPTCLWQTKRHIIGYLVLDQKKGLLQITVNVFKMISAFSDIFYSWLVFHFQCPSVCPHPSFEMFAHFMVHCMVRFTVAVSGKMDIVVKGHAI